MLQLANGSIVERPEARLESTVTYTDLPSSSGNYVVGSINYSAWPYNPTVYWNSYPVYVCSDRTAKAIEVLKALQAEKILEVKSVPKFIELVEKISRLL